MTEFKAGQRVRVNEGELEGIEGFVLVAGPHVTSVKLNLMSGEVTVPIYTEMLDNAAEPHEALAKLQSLYPDFLKTDRYRYRLTTYVHGLSYVSSGTLTSATLEIALDSPPAGLEKVEFMQKNDDPNRGLAWKLLWAA